MCMGVEATATNSQQLLEDDIDANSSGDTEIDKHIDQHSFSALAK